MAEHALSYVITLVIVFNVIVIAALAAIVLFMPRTTRRRPAHRAETAPVRNPLALVSPRSQPARRVAARAA